VGPNGSGKSNLMDAISFVLGVRTAQLRGSLRELLYLNSEGDTEQDRPTRGHVRLVYSTDAGELVTFGRHIQPSDAAAETFHSVYKINDRTVTSEAYNQRLGSYGILVKVRNFLVFQVRAVLCALSASPGCLQACHHLLAQSASLDQSLEVCSQLLPCDTPELSLLPPPRCCAP
jgi:structural maintenance of chromosome 1